MSRRWWIACLVVLFLGVVAGWNLYVLITRPRWCINRERFERIHEGMTRAEVIAVIGLPPGDYTVVKDPHRPFVLGEDGSVGVLDAWDDAWPIGEEWSSDEGIIIVCFGDDRVVSRWFQDSKDYSPRDWSDMLHRLFARKPMP